MIYNYSLEYKIYDISNYIANDWSIMCKINRYEMIYERISVFRKMVVLNKDKDLLELKEKIN